MKMRLKPLRGLTYKVDGWEEPLTFVEMAGEKMAVVYHSKSGIFPININHLDLPIIDTKDYEKIPDPKYKGD